MTTENTLLARSNGKCELCSAELSLSVYPIPPEAEENADTCILLCKTCLGQINQPDTMDHKHWRCLNDSMWSQIPAVQVMAWRTLKQLSSETWAQDLLEMLYLDDETLSWAESGLIKKDNDHVPTLDSNGVELLAGDTVIIIKDLDVKGAGFTAKRGTAVRNISLTSNPEQIEGRVNGTKIVLLTCFLKKSN